MSAPKAFPAWQVLSITTGRLLGDIGGVYEILNWMSGDELFTHQLPRVMKEAAPVIVALHPALSAATAEAEQVTGENYKQWLATWVERYGETITVPKLTRDQHERIDPLSELAEKVHPSRIVVVRP